MKTLLFDIEGNSLAEVYSRGNKYYPETSTVHCAVVMDYDTKEIFEFVGEAGIRDCCDLLNSGDLLVAHNGYGYDIPVLHRLFGLDASIKCFDTLVCSRLMFPDRQSHPLSAYDNNPNSLRAWGRYLGEFKADYDGGFDEFSERMLAYCRQDVVLLRRIYDEQLKWYAENTKLLDFELMACQHLMLQTEDGFGYDLAGGRKLEMEYAIESAEIADKLQKSFPPTVTQMKKPAYYTLYADNDVVETRPTKGALHQWAKAHFLTTKDYTIEAGPPMQKVEPFNPSSRQQIADRLIQKYGWKPTEFTDNGQAQVSEEILKTLDYPEAQLLVTYFDIEKKRGMVDDWNTRASMSRDGRIHGSINPQGALGGRCTHSQPNVSQVPKDERCRSLWYPGVDDYVQVGCDLSGLELRMLAHFMSPWDGGAYGEVILNGDIHTHNMKLAGLSNRDQAKTFIYGLIYGAGATKIGQIVGGSARQGQRLKDQFLRGLPALEKLQQKVQFDITKGGGVVMIDGRKIPIRKEHAALNTLLQGSGSILSKGWMLLAAHRTRHMRCFQMSYSHDEVQYAVHKDDANKVAGILEKAATDAGQRFGLGIRIDAESSIGANWWDTH